MLNSKELMTEFSLRTSSRTVSAFYHLILTQMKILENRLSSLSMRRKIDLQPPNAQIDLESFKLQKLSQEKNHINNKFMVISKRINKVQLLKCNPLVKDMMSFIKKILTKNSLLGTHSQIKIKLLLLTFRKFSLFC